MRPPHSERERYPGFALSVANDGEKFRSCWTPSPTSTCVTHVHVRVTYLPLYRLLCRSRVAS